MVHAYMWFSSQPKSKENSPKVHRKAVNGEMGPLLPQSTSQVSITHSVLAHKGSPTPHTTVSLSAKLCLR